MTNQSSIVKSVAKQNSFTKEELLKCGRGEMFGAGNAQLPLPPMLMFDRIVSITEDGGKYGNGQIIAELDIRPDLWFFDCHFTGDPVMPGCLGSVSYTHLDVYKRQGSSTSS